MIRILTLFTVLLYGITLNAQASLSGYPQKHYNKTVYEIPMRDGIKLYTVVYTPKDSSKVYPILMMRTCYSVGPYGADNFPKSLGPNPYLMQDGYIFVYQDVRGRYMSEGQYSTMTPNIPGNEHKEPDESSDTYDTIDWLLKNLKGHNGKVGMWGVSYPGFYTAAALPDAHPALVASSPQAPIADFYFDDFHHNGAFTQAYLYAYPVFGYQKTGKTVSGWYGQHFIKTDQKDDGYKFNLSLGSLKNVDRYYGKDNFFWQETIEHPDYDSFWQARSLIPHLKDINHAVMTVGGLFDAEDLYGPFSIYKAIEKNCPGTYNTLVMGPWAHGDWHREKGRQILNHIHFGDSISTFFMKNIERPFFNCKLKGECSDTLPEAFIFDSGNGSWSEFGSWPPVDVQNKVLRPGKNGRLDIGGEADNDLKFTYFSDPANPVPYRSETEPLVFTPRAYMTDDQRHNSKRKDVLSFQTEILTEDVTLTGEVIAKLKVAVEGEDADFIVKIIDVLPEKHPYLKYAPAEFQKGNYQMLVRSEIMRGRYRNSFEKPEPFVPNEKTGVDVKLQDIHHTFKKGHRIMIQIQSSWFPLFDRNPQTFVKNIYKAEEKDFKEAVITIFGDSEIIIGKTNP